MVTISRRQEPVNVAAYDGGYVVVTELEDVGGGIIVPRVWLTRGNAELAPKTWTLEMGERWLEAMRHAR